MTAAVADLRAAIAMLTRLPVGAVVDGRPGAAAFPLVGLGIGVAAAIPVAILGAAEPVLAGIAAVALMALASGALHLDAVADTADALMAPDPERAEAARRDPRIGSGGVVALILVVGAEVAAIASLAGSVAPVVAAATVVVAATVARVVPVVVVAPWIGRASRSAGADGDVRHSTSDWFAAQVGRGDAVVALAVSVVVVAAAWFLTSAPVVALGAVAGGIFGLLMALAIRSLRGRWDGDALGAAIELTGLTILVVSAMLHG